MKQWRRGCVVVTAVTLAALCSTGTAHMRAQVQTQAGAEGASALTPEALRWAYPASPPGVVHPADEVVRQVPGSPLSLTRAQIEDPFGPPDWFPDEHPLMPEVVAHGRRPAVRACAQCHLPNGLGHPQSANLAGLPAAYCTAPGFLDSGLKVFASTRPRPARRGRVAPARGFGKRISRASIVRCMSA